MDLIEAAKIMHRAGYEDSHESLMFLADRTGVSAEEYEAQRTGRHMEAALREFATQIWAEGYGAASWKSYQRTGVSIGRADEATPPCPYAHTSDDTATATDEAHAGPDRFTEGAEERPDTLLEALPTTTVKPTIDDRPGS